MENINYKKSTFHSAYLYDFHYNPEVELFIYGSINNNYFKNCLCSIKEKRKEYEIPYHYIIYLSSHGKRTVIHTEDKDYETSILLKEFYNKLPQNVFMRIHKQFIVNILYFGKMRCSSDGRYLLKLTDSDDNLLPVGRKYVPDVKIILHSRENTLVE